MTRLAPFVGAASPARLPCSVGELAAALRVA